jgi:predicted nucleic acid-binding protein
VVVVDASVVLSLFLEEEEGAAAEALLLAGADRPALSAPEVLEFEVASALTRRVRRATLPAEHVLPLMARLPRLGIRAHPVGPLLPAAVALSLENRHGVPDCLYLALARAEGASALATFDRRLVALARRLAIPLWPFPEASPP